MRVQDPLGVVTPTVDGPVLQILAAADRAFTTSELARRVDRSAAGVRLVLNRLAGQGIVDISQVGTTFAYRLNREHLAADAVIALAQLKAALFDRLRSDVATWEVRPRLVAVFGSAARGDMDDDSDIDILVVGDQDIEPMYEQVDRLQHRVRRWTGNDCRVMVLETAVVEQHAADDPALGQIADQGVVVLGDPRWLRRQVRRGQLVRHAG